MKTLTLFLTTSAAICLGGATLLGQGDLVPSGPPGESMKTLAQVEPRIDLATVAGNGQSEMVITNAGSYYLSANLEVGKSDGIRIATTGVTVDLNGFQIRRVSGTGGNGINISGGSDRATIRNGVIVGFDYGIRCYFSPSYARGCLIEKITVSGAGVYGMRIGPFARVIDCGAQGNPGSGIRVMEGSLVSGCTVSGNQGPYGLYASAGSMIRNCAAYGNAGIAPNNYGIYAGSACSVVACVSHSNSNTNSPSTSLQGVGILAGAGSTVKDCTVRNNRGDGIRVTSDCLVVGNACDGNGVGSGDGAGIYVLSSDNRIDGNLVTDNRRGIEVGATGNFIVRNSASGNATHYDIPAGNKNAEVLAPGANFTATNPWANFEF